MKTLIKNLKKEIKLRETQLEVAEVQSVKTHIMGIIYGLTTALALAENIRGK